MDADHLEIVATVRSPRGITREEAIRIQRELAARLQLTVALKLLIVPITILDPLMPPTPSQTLQPGTTPTPTLRPLHGSPTRLRLVPRLGGTDLRSHATPPTEPPHQRQLHPTPTPTPLAYMAIGATDREGANVRLSPGFTTIVTSEPDALLLQLTGRRAERGWSLVG